LKQARIPAELFTIDVDAEVVDEANAGRTMVVGSEDAEALQEASANIASGNGDEVVASAVANATSGSGTPESGGAAAIASSAASIEMSSRRHVGNGEETVSVSDRNTYTMRVGRGGRRNRRHKTRASVMQLFGDTDVHASTVESAETEGTRPDDSSYALASDHASAGKEGAGSTDKGSGTWASQA